MRFIVILEITFSTFASVVAQTSSAPAFEVASIKPSIPGSEFWIRPAANGSRLNTKNVTVRRMIMRTYSIADWQISGGPAWIDSDRYDIDAKPEHPVSSEQLLLMLQTLLADRFKLSMHRETAERSIYALTVEKGGSKLKAHQGGDDDQQGNNYNGAGHAACRNCSMARLANFLSVQTGHSVVDRTGIEGGYDFTLDFAPVRAAPDSRAPSSRSIDTRPEIFTSLREQLGLKLEPQKGTVEMFHIDRVEKPAGN